MSIENIQQQFCDAVQLLTERAISQAKFDRTVQAVVQECLDETNGHYKVKYQNSVYHVTADTSAKYKKGSSVYILIPDGDFSKSKKIIGTVDGLGSDLVSLVEGDNMYERIGTNIVNTPGEFSISSFKSEKKFLYNANSDSNLIEIDSQAANEYLKSNSHMIVSARFKTQIEAINRGYGNFGIVFGLNFLDEELGEPVTREYILEVDNMVGQPYYLPMPTKQSAEYDIAGSSFQRVEYIYIFSEKFLHQDENKEDDIFISAIELSSAVLLNEDALNAYYLSIVTPKGTFFTEVSNMALNELPLHAQVRIKGLVAREELHPMEFYWFIEQAGVDSKNIFYNQYGGQGWRCLNQYNEIKGAIGEDGSQLSEDRVEWIPADSTYVVKKEDSLAFETKYKCVCVYDKNIILSKEITIKNYDANYAIKILSSNGNKFYYDHGQTDLKCQIFNPVDTELDNSKELLYNYYWSRVNSVKAYEVLEETIQENESFELYQNALKHVLDALESGKLYKENIYSREIIFAEIEDKDKYSVVAEEVEKHMPPEGAIIEDFVSVLSRFVNNRPSIRVSKNHIYNVKAKDISNFTTYICSVYDAEDKLIGTDSLTLTNSYDEQPKYTLFLNEGNQVFKYDENGVSPSHISKEDAIQLKTLSFVLFDENGIPFSEDVIRKNCKVYWTIPSKDTLIMADMEMNEEDIIDNGDSKTYTNTLIFNYNLFPVYHAEKTNNEIQLTVVYKDKIEISTSTNFTILKEGDFGTNGTAFAARIIPNVKDGDEVPELPVLTFLESAESKVEMNYNIKSSTGTNASKEPGINDYNKWFTTELWENDQLIPSSEYTVQWSILANKYNSGCMDSSTFKVDSSTGEFEINSTQAGNVAYSDHPANIVKAVITYQDKEYIASLPITTIVNYRPNRYRFSYKEGSGYRSVIYTSDGVNPKYDSNNLFEVHVEEFINGSEIDVSLENDFTYEWNVLGQTFEGKKLPDGTPVFDSAFLLQQYKQASGGEILKNCARFVPSNKYDGKCVSVAVEVKIYNKQTLVGVVHKPIHFLLNRFGLAAINGWDGNSISLNEEGGMILSPQVGAGVKDENNRFTGLLMGAVEEPNSNKQIGLLGFNQGQRTIFLDAETGKAEFGINDKGKIIIDPTENEARILSGAFKSGTGGTGMEINLTNPTIKWGNGNFEVDEYGRLTAKGSGSLIGNWKIDVNGCLLSTNGQVGFNPNPSKEENGVTTHQVAIWAGNSISYQAPFRVNNVGRMVCTSGSIGGWEVDDKNIFTGSMVNDASTSPARGAVRLSKDVYSSKICNVKLDKLRFNIGSNFGVTEDGTMYSKGATIEDVNIKSLKLKGNAVEIKSARIPVDATVEGSITFDKSGYLMTSSTGKIVSFTIDNKTFYAWNEKPVFTGVYASTKSSQTLDVGFSKTQTIWYFA